MPPLVTPPITTPLLFIHGHEERKGKAGLVKDKHELLETETRELLENGFFIFCLMELGIALLFIFIHL